MGVAMRRNLNEDGTEGELEASRLPFFNYTKKEIVSIKNWNTFVAAEINRVKTLKNGKTARWTETLVHLIKPALQQLMQSAGQQKAFLHSPQLAFIMLFKTHLIYFAVPVLYHKPTIKT